MDLSTYLRAIRRSWWILLVAGLLGLVVGQVAIALATPRYQSSVVFFVSTPSDPTTTSSLQSDQFAQRRISSYVGLLTSDRVVRLVMDATHTSQSADEVRQSISASADVNTVLLTATVTNASEEQSLAYATAIAERFGGLVGELENRGVPGPANVVLNVVSGPALNPVAVSPRKTLYRGFGLLVGLVVGLAAGVVRELVLDRTVRSPDILRTMSSVPVLGSISFDKHAKRNPVVVGSSTRSVRAEAFRKLRTSLQFIDAERPVKVIVVTSSVAEEGKSTTAVNLCLALVESDRRVLLIEADLRRPRVAHYLGLEGSVGLANVLAGQVEVHEVLQPWGPSGLTVLASGTIPPNPSELLGSPAMSRMLDALGEEFDLVVIDTPPILPVTDAAVVAVQADGVVLVVRHAKTSRHQVKATFRSLEAVDARVLGTVLNMVPTRGRDAYAAYEHHIEQQPPISVDEPEVDQPRLAAEVPAESAD